jgi:hypothetical protein
MEEKILPSKREREREKRLPEISLPQIFSA